MDTRSTANMTQFAEDAAMRFFDTNILVYTQSDQDPVKRKVACDLPSSLKRARYEQWRHVEWKIDDSVLDFQVLYMQDCRRLRLVPELLSNEKSPTAATKNRQPPQRKIANRRNEKPPTAATR